MGDPSEHIDRTVQAIFANASTFIREPVNLEKLVTAIDELHWFSEERDSFGDLYEGLLQKNAEETKRGAGQYFTPRVLIGILVRLMKPAAGETIQDPAAGTGGFLIAAERAIRAATDDYFTLAPKQQEFQVCHALHGMENVQGVYRLLLMNLFLHGIDAWHIELHDTLSPDGAVMSPPDLILTNPPFGPAGGRPSRDDLTVTSMVSSYQLPFVEHCIRALKPGGRAAVIVPDNVLFEDGRGRDLRQMLMDRCDLHTIMRLPNRHLLRAGRQDQRDLLPQGLEGGEQYRNLSGSTTCAPTCPPSAKLIPSQPSTSQISKRSTETTRMGKVRASIKASGDGFAASRELKLPVAVII